MFAAQRTPTSRHIQSLTINCAASSAEITIIIFVDLYNKLQYTRENMCFVRRESRFIVLNFDTQRIQFIVFCVLRLPASIHFYNSILLLICHIFHCIVSSIHRRRAHYVTMCMLHFPFSYDYYYPFHFKVYTVLKKLMYGVRAPHTYKHAPRFEQIAVCCRVVEL